MNGKPLAVGIDASTQGVKALALGPDGVEAVAAVNFGKDLPAFGCPDGFLPGADPLVRHADPKLWLAALDGVLAKLQASAKSSRPSNAA